MLSSNKFWAAVVVPQTSEAQILLPYSYVNISMAGSDGNLKSSHSEDGAKRLKYCITCNCKRVGECCLFQVFMDLAKIVGSLIKVEGDNRYWRSTLSFAKDKV